MREKRHIFEENISKSIPDRAFNNWIFVLKSIFNVLCFYQIAVFTAVKIWTIKIYHGKNLGGKNSMSTVSFRSALLSFMKTAGSYWKEKKQIKRLFHNLISIPPSTFLDEKGHRIHDVLVASRRLVSNWYIFHTLLTL